MPIVNVILSGGVGSRLWPLSRKSKPKQYIPLFEGNTLFQICAERNKAVADVIQVIGSVDNYQLSRDNFALCNITGYKEIIEASPRNTAASIAFAAFTAEPDDLLLVTPSDHIIDGTNEYNAAVRQAADLAAQGFLVTFGAVPQRPETGYGYIEHDEVYNVLSFKEKPSLDKAAAYLASGRYLWNSGMFCFKASVYLEELERYTPEVFRTSRLAIDKMKEGFLPPEETMNIPSISVDYAVMEHSKKIKVVPFSFGWSDLGSFESVWYYLEKQKGERIDNLVLGSKKHVEFLGLENIVLVETDDAILVMPRDQAQDVKKVYERLESENPSLLK